MDITDYLRFVFALAFVIALILILAVLAKRYGLGYRTISKRTMKRRLSISEIMPLDGKRKLVLVRRDDQEHLLLIGGMNDLVVEKVQEENISFDDYLESEPSLQPEEKDTQGMIS